MTEVAWLPGRAVLAVSGADRVAFLNGLVSNDVAEAAPGRAVWAALLTPQGKYLADFFVFADGERLLLDAEAALAEDVRTRLRRYRLRAAVEIEPSPARVYAGWNGPPPSAAGCAAPDPRLKEAGWRLLTEDPAGLEAEAGVTVVDASAYDRHRLALGLPDGTRDLEREKTVLLEAGFDELNGVSWTKGCYMGQELTARTRYRGLIKRRLLPVQGEMTLPPPGTPVVQAGAEVGQLRSGAGALGLATLRLDALDGEGLSAAGVALRVQRPGWVRVPQQG